MAWKQATTTTAAALLALLAAGCAKEMPVEPDGSGRLYVTVADISGFFPGSEPGVPFAVDSVEVRLIARTHDLIASTNTGDGSEGSFVKLPTGRYSVFARKEVIDEEGKKKIFTGSADILVEGTSLVEDSVITDIVGTSDLLINEVFYCGSDYSSFYFYDQYVELYNSARDTLWLDGMIITRQYQSEFPDQDEVDYVRALYSFQFPGTPGTGRQYPIAPGQFVVVAADAVDHSVWTPKSIDLSVADWEFFNALGNDYDNPDVPNVISIDPSSRIDYLINVSHGAVVLGSGVEYSFLEYGEGKFMALIPIATVVDGIEYASTTEATKELTYRVDAGFAGLGNSKYSGQSTERRELGLDTNDSTFDFVLTSPPTVGYSHVQ